MPSGSPKYTDPVELQKKIDEYFEYVKGERTLLTEGVSESSVAVGIHPEWIREPEKVTITGLILYLGFCDRSSFYKYGENEVFRHTIKKAHSRIEQHYENFLIGNNVAGPIFALKNLQWKDQTQSEVVTTHVEQPLYGEMTPERKAEILKIIDERQGNI